MSEKIYATDTNLPFRSTKKRPIDTKRDIDGDLARWGIFQVGWTWDLEHNNVEIVFQLPREKFKELTINPVVKLTPPIIWKHKAKRSKKPDEVDWRMSMRLLYWWLHSQLAMVYANQSSKAVAFLPYIQVSEKENVADLVIPRLSLLKALPEPDPDRQEKKEIPIE